MTILTATPVIDWMYRGSYYILTLQIKDENDNVFDITNYTGKLRLAHSHTDANSILELNADVFDPDNGQLRFIFLVATTADLSAKGYDLSVILYDNTGKPFPVLQDRFGIVSLNPEVV